MVNTRSKFKKIQNTLKTCFPRQPSIADDSSHQSTQSGELIGSNDDLLTEILRLLPAKSILRFKSVSKHWLSLLSNRHFTLLFDNLSNSLGLFYRDLYIPFDNENQITPPFHSLDFYPDLRGIRIVQSCNGLLLCCSDRGTERTRKYYVCNPTTNQFDIIPSIPGGPDVRRTIRFMGLAFHQTDCIHYKVVCIHLAKPDEEFVRNIRWLEFQTQRVLFQIQIYSPDTRKWKISSESFSGPCNTPFTCGVYWNGAIHWTPSCLNPLYFKLDGEQLQKLPLPSPLPVRVESSGGYQNGRMPLYFGESRGYLHLVDTASNINLLHLNVYEMLGDYSGWFIKYQVELDALSYAYPDMTHGYDYWIGPTYDEFKVLEFVRGEKEGDTFMVVKIPFKIKRFNLLDKSFKHLFDLPTIGYGRITHSEVHRYIETLGAF